MAGSGIFRRLFLRYSGEVPCGVAVKGKTGRRVALQIVVLLTLVYPFVSSTFRDNDQATILSSSWQLARGQAPFFHASFYNFDKQWGVFLALSWLFRLRPRADPILAANVLLTVLVTVSWICLGIRTRRVPLPLLLPVLFAPVLILYMPFLGTGWFSLAFLLLAFCCLGQRSSAVGRTAGLGLVAIAAACRADVALAIPALGLSLVAREHVRNLWKRSQLWELAAAAVLPVLVGKWMAGAGAPDSNPYSFDLRAFAGFLFFGLSPAMLVLLAAVFLAFMKVARQKRRFRVFYVALAVSLLVPLGFYLPQLYTLRYFFLTIAVVLFVSTSRRGVCLYRATGRPWRWMPAGLVAVTIAPWLVGWRLPVLRHPSLTLTNPTRFPSGDGQFPMGAYLGFAWQTRTRDRLEIDHNQKMWLAAESVQYEACADGRVPFLITPMSNYLELAIRLQGKEPRAIDYMAESACGMAYVDARSIMRGYRPDVRDGAFFEDEMTEASRVENGQMIVRVNMRGRRSALSRVLEELPRALDRRQGEIFAWGGSSSQRSVPIAEGIRYAVFGEGPCTVQKEKVQRPVGLALIWAAWTGSGREQTVRVNCGSGFAGWARSELPAYLGM